QGAIAMLCAGAGSNDQDGNAFSAGVLAQLGHQLVAGHARHFQVGDDEMAAELGDEFGGFQAIGSELGAIAILFQHAGDELADADGVVGNNDDAFLFDAVDGFAGDGATSDCSRTGSENARGAGAGLNGATFVGLGGDHTIQVDEQDEAAIRSDGGAGEELHAAEIFAKIFDYDFVFAEDFFDDEANLTIPGIGDDHAEIAVDGLERRQAEIGIKADDFSDDVANLGEEFAANIFNFIGAQAANFLHDGERKGEMIRAATYEESGRDD